MFNNVLLLGQGPSVDRFIKWFQKHNCSFLSVSDQPAKTRYKEFSDLRAQPIKPLGLTHKLDPSIFYGSELKTWIDAQQFRPEWIINCYDQKQFIEIEYELGAWYQTRNELDYHCAQFFTYKSVQDSVCKQLNIPTLPTSSSSGLCVKRDYKPTSHEQLSIPKFRWQPSDYQSSKLEFAQAWCDLEAIYNLHIAVDQSANWTLFECAKLEIERSMIIHEWSPWIPTQDEQAQIEMIVKKLQSSLHFSCRICLYQLAKVRGDSTLYNLDWNSRIGGDNILKKLGVEIGSFDVLASLWDQSLIPGVLEFTKQYRGDSVWWHNRHRFVTGDPLKRREWWQDPTVAWTWKIAPAEHHLLKLVKL